MVTAMKSASGKAIPVAAALPVWVVAGDAAAVVAAVVVAAEVVAATAAAEAAAEAVAVVERTDDICYR